MEVVLLREWGEANPLKGGAENILTDRLPNTISKIASKTRLTSRFRGLVEFDRLCSTSKGPSDPISFICISSPFQRKISAPPLTYFTMILAVEPGSGSTPFLFERRCVLVLRKDQGEKKGSLVLARFCKTQREGAHRAPCGQTTGVVRAT